MGSATLFRALAHRNFRLYLGGQGLSIVGTWTQQVAMAWLVFQLTESPVWLGLAGLAGQLPALFVTPLAGGLIDRCDRFRLLLLTQTVAMTQAFVLALLTLSGVVTVGHVLILSLVAGVVNAFDIPTRQSFLSQLVGSGNDLPNAIALNSSVFNGARIVGPALAGLLLAVTSTGVCFLLNGASYLAVLAALLAMRLPQQARETTRGPLLGGVFAGWSYAWQSAPIRSLLLLIGCFNMAGLAETTLLPILSTVVLGGDASTLGLLSAAAGAGAFSAAVILASRRSVRGLDAWIRTMPALFGIGLTTLSFTHAVWAVALLSMVTGFALLLLTAAANTLLQTMVEEDKRGRVMSLYTMAVTGLAPLGGMAAGLLADQFGALVTLRLAGLACTMGSVIFALHFRPMGAARGAVAYGGRFSLSRAEACLSRWATSSRRAWSGPGKETSRSRCR